MTYVPVPCPQACQHGPACLPPEWVGGRLVAIFVPAVPQMPLLAQWLVLGKGDFGEEALSISSHL